MKNRQKNDFTSLLWQAIFVGMIILTWFHILRYYSYSEIWDEPAMMSEAWAMMHGQVLYRDIYHIHPPFQFFIFVPFFWLLPAHLAPLGVRIMNVLLVYFGAFLIRKIHLSLYRDSWLANLSAVLFIFYLGLWRSAGSQGEFYTVFPILATLYFILAHDRISNSIAFFIGFLWGMAFFVKQISAFDIIPLAIAWFMLREDDAPVFIKKFALAICGGMLSTVLAFLYALSKGAVIQTTQSILHRNAALYVSVDTQGSSQPSWIRFLISYAHQCVYFIHEISQFPIIVYGLFPLMLLGLVLIQDFDQSILRVRRRCIYLSFLWISFIFIGFAMSGRSYFHYLIQLVIPMVLLYCACIGPANRALKKVVVLAIVFLCLYSAASFFAKDHRNATVAQNEIRRLNESATYLRENTKPTDTIFLFEECQVNIFYLSGRLSPNGIYQYSDMIAQHTNDPESERQMRQRLQEHLPKAILWGPCFFDSPERQYFVDLINRQYSLKTTIGLGRIYFRQDR